MKFYPTDLFSGTIFYYAIVIFVTILLFPPVNGMWTETFKAVGVATASATGLFAPFIAIAMARYQSQLTTDLEGLKKTYSTDIERLKSSLSSGLEVKKALIAGRIRAFDTMLTAAHFYYYVIRQQVSGESEINVESLRLDADKKSGEASSVVWHLNISDRGKWFTVYQLSNNLSVLLRHCEPSQREQVFNTHAQDLGLAIEELEKAGLAAFDEADKFQLKIAEDEFRISNRPLLG